MFTALFQFLWSRKLLVGSVLALALGVGCLWLADPDYSPLQGPATQAEPPDPAAAKGPPLSDAERIARLQHSLDTDKTYLDSLQKQLEGPKSEFHWAEKNFQQLDAERQAILDLKAEGKTAEATAKEKAAGDLEVRWQRARERFNLAIKERQTLQETVTALTQKIQDEQRALDRLSGVVPPTAQANPPPAASSGQAAAPPSAAAAAPPKPTEKPATPSAPAAALNPFSVASSTPPSSPAAAPAPVADNVPREVVRAREKAKVKEDEAKKAEKKAERITRRLDDLRGNIALAKQLLETARKRIDEEQQTRALLDAEMNAKVAAHAPEADIRDVAQRQEWSGKRLTAAQAEVRATTDRLHDLHDQLNTVQAEQLAALRDADAKKQAAEAADDKVTQLQNPFRLRHIAQWLLHHGPRLVLIVAGMLLFYRFARVVSRRIVLLMARGETMRGTLKDRENRAETLVGVFSSVASALILGGGSLMILDEVGIPIVPLMGGAAVIGLAVAFGAQNLIKDYFSGFMVLLEDQYGINDVVKIGPISGLVEHISLRMTVLRDLEGVVHFIPHGTITTVSNLTHGWSRALFDVGVAYKEDLDRVMDVLLRLGHELRKDPTFGPLILDDPEMLGVDNLADSAVVIKFFLKTRPLQQWTVKREMLRRIKKTFEELNIEIPYPQQTVYHRYESPPPAGRPYPPPGREAA